MSKLQETPRQKMIGIMYLVLLGFMALSISSSVLDAFRYLTQSLSQSTKNVQNNVDNTFASFEATKLKDEPERARPVYEKAKQVRAYAADLDAYILDIRKQMEDEAGGYDGTGDIKRRDNQDISYRLMINQGRGKKLRKMIMDTRSKMLAVLPAQDQAGLNIPLDAQDPPSRGAIRKVWEQTNFGDGIPLTAALTNLTKIRADLKNTEFEIVKKILGQVDKAVVNLDRFAAVAVAPTSYVIQGQPYTAEVFLTASDSHANSEVSVNGQQLPNRDGKGVYTAATSKEGIFSWVGKIKVMQTDGTVKEYQTEEQHYQVARPSAVVSADKMNVLYIGVPNPLSVSAPGVPKEKIRVSVSGGSLSGSAGHYSVSVSQIGTAKVVVSAEVAPGKVQTLSSTDFRVKRIPDPRVKFGGKTGGRMSSVAIRSQNKLFPVLDNFDFDAKFTITRFSLIIVKPRADAMVFQGTGNILTGQMTAGLQGVTPGSRVIFDNIIAVGPDGMQRQLDPVSLLAE